MKGLPERLQELREMLDLGQKEIAAKIGVGRSTYASWETGHRTPELGHLERLAEIGQVSIDWLMGRVDVITVDAPKIHRSTTPASNREDNTSHMRPMALQTIRFAKGVGSMPTIAAQALPVIGRIVAGVPLLSEQHVIATIEVPLAIASQAEFALQVHGDSMIGAGLQAGDYVFMRQASKRQPSHGDIVAAMIDESEMTLKRYIKRDGTHWLHAENPAYQDIPVDGRVQIQGVYLGRFSEYQGTVDPPIDDMTRDELISKLAKIDGQDPDTISALLDVLNRTKR